MLDGLISAGVLHDGANLSNHSAIYVKFEVGKMNLRIAKNHTKKQVSWNSATDEAKNDFKQVLENKLKLIKYKHECLDVNCRQEDHINNLEDFTISVLEAMETAGKECLPYTYLGSRGKGGIPGWNEFIKPFSEESRFWYSIWVSAGKPRIGEIYSIMKSKKLQYKYAVRRLKRCKDMINNDKLLKALVTKDKCIFQEVKKLRKKKVGLSSRIDENVSPDSIANHFSEIYTKLYNNVTDDEKLEPIIHRVEQNIDKSAITTINAVDKNMVESAIKNMKPNKRDCIFEATSDMYLHAPDNFYDYISIILRQSLVHGNLPHIVLLCTLMPLIKDSLGDITKSENYRAIAGSCLLLKVLDLVILKMEGSKLGTDSLQFAYKANTGTSTCTWAVTAVVDHFTRKGKPLFGAAMNM